MEHQSVLIDDASVQKLHVVVVEKNVLENIPFILIGLGILLGGIFMIAMCRQKVPEVSAGGRPPMSVNEAKLPWNVMENIRKDPKGF